MRRRKIDISGIPPLTDYLTSKANCLTIVGAQVLKLYSEGVPQVEIARRLGTSRAGITYWVRKLKRHGLIHLTNNARGAHLPPFDVRWRSIYRKLTNPVKLPQDEEHFTNGVKHTSWKVRDCLIRQHNGPNSSSLEIEAGYCGGRSIDEATIKHDKKAEHLFDWLCEQFPKLKEVAGPPEIHKGGEICLNSLRGLAKQALDNTGASIIKGEAYKIDQSRGYPEFQIYFDKLATKDDLQAISGAVLELSKSMAELVNTVKGEQYKPELKLGPSSDYR